VFSSNAAFSDFRPDTTSDLSSAAEQLTLEGRGGAIYGGVDSTVSISNSTFVNNTASLLGGVLWSEATVGIEDSTFSKFKQCSLPRSSTRYLCTIL
jgi:hypothetical protein